MEQLSISQFLHQLRLRNKETREMKVFVAVLCLAAVASASPFGQARITGGQDAKLRVVPSFVAIHTEFDSASTNCGGVLMIDQKTIITTVPCVNK